MFSVTWHFPSDDSTTRYVYCVCMCLCERAAFRFYLFPLPDAVTFQITDTHLISMLACVSIFSSFFDYSSVWGCFFFLFWWGVFFLSLCSFDFILHGLRKLFNVKITTKRSKHNQSPKNDQWFSHAMVTLVVPFKVKYCLWNIPATFFWVLKIYSHFLRDPFETKGGCFPIKQEWALSTI